MRLALWLTILAVNLASGELFDAVKSEYLKLFNEQNYGAALEIALQAAEGADAQAQLEAGYVYETIYGDYVRAVRYYKLSASGGEPQAALNLGYLFLRMSDYSRALGYIGEALERQEALGSEHAADGYYRRGMVRLDPRRGKLHDPKAAVADFANAARLGGADGTFMLGVCYGLGVGVSADEQKSGELVERAAGLGSEDARKVLSGFAGIADFVVK